MVASLSFICWLESMFASDLRKRLFSHRILTDKMSSFLSYNASVPLCVQLCVCVCVCWCFCSAFVWDQLADTTLPLTNYSDFCGNWAHSFDINSRKLFMCLVWFTNYPLLNGFCDLFLCVLSLKYRVFLCWFADALRLSFLLLSRLRLAPILTWCNDEILCNR